LKDGMVERCRFFNLTRMFQKDWIPGQVTPPNRYALRRGPQQPGMTQYLVGVVRFRACGADCLDGAMASAGTLLRTHFCHSLT